MIFAALLVCMTMCAVVPACLFLVNLSRFRHPAGPLTEDVPRAAVLIPARNEEENIDDALKCVLASRDVDLEVLVYDDASTDRTAAIVRECAVRDARVRLVVGEAFPSGWNGKQHACWRLAEASTAPLLLFLDADVRLEPDAIARCIAQQRASGVALLSGFPRLITKTWMEWLLLPLIQFVLLGFLPMGRMRRTTVPAYAAGCGQFMLAERGAYFACGGHAAIRETRHDGLRLPHLFREHGLRTDICDLTELASVRMYCSAAGVWNGLAKNATEGLGASSRIVPLTALLLLGQVVPGMLLFAILLLWIPVGILLGSMGVDIHFTHSPATRVEYWCYLIAMIASFLPRLVSCHRFRQPLRSALLHPVGISFLVAVQWYALVRKITGNPVDWRTRSYIE